MDSRNLHILLDTNIYGLICEMPNSAQFVQKISASGFLVCGSQMIRAELRNIPLHKTIFDKSLRIMSLQIYDSLVTQKRNYAIEESVKVLAEEYNLNYFGSHSWNELKNDFLIVATASIHKASIICSNDVKTLSSKECISAYKIVNQKHRMSLPNFTKFEAFKEIIK